MNLCPYCPYVDRNGKTHNPLAKAPQEAITVHRETHRAERVSIIQYLRDRSDGTIDYVEQVTKAGLPVTQANLDLVRQSHFAVQEGARAAADAIDAGEHLL